MMVNAKKIQLEEDRLVEIEHQNRKLLTNLSKISERKGVEGHEVGKSKALKRGQAPPGKHRSLNIMKRQEELNRIERENALILRRIQEQNNRTSEFSVKKMESDWKETQKHRNLNGAMPWVSAAVVATTDCQQMLPHRCHTHQQHHTGRRRYQ